MLIAIVPILFLIVGLVLYLAARDAQDRMKEIGRAFMWAGLFATAFAEIGRTIHIG